MLVERGESRPSFLAAMSAGNMSGPPRGTNIDRGAVRINRTARDPGFHGKALTVLLFRGCFSVKSRLLFCEKLEREKEKLGLKEKTAKEKERTAKEKEKARMGKAKVTKEREKQEGGPRSDHRTPKLAIKEKEKEREARTKAREEPSPSPEAQCGELEIQTMEPDHLKRGL